MCENELKPTFSTLKAFPFAASYAIPIFFSVSAQKTALEDSNKILQHYMGGEWEASDYTRKT